MKYKGYELYKLIAERKIEKGTKFIDKNKQKWIYDGEELIVEGKDYTDFVFSKMKFKLIKEEV